VRDDLSAGSFDSVARVPLEYVLREKRQFLIFRSVVLYGTGIILLVLIGTLVYWLHHGPSIAARHLHATTFFVTPVVALTSLSAVFGLALIRFVFQNPHQNGMEDTKPSLWFNLAQELVQSLSGYLKKKA